MDLWEEKIKKDKHNAKQKKKKETEDFDVIDDVNPFLDFEDEVDVTTKKGNHEKKSKEANDLQVEEYYDDLLEQIKTKNSKKRKFQLEKALKEVRMLEKKTAELKKIFLKQKKEEQAAPIQEKKPERKHKENKAEKPKDNVTAKQKLSPQDKKYYDEVFKKTKWNELIDWGNSKYKN